MTGIGVLSHMHVKNIQMVVWDDDGNAIVSFSDSNLIHTVSYQEGTTT